MASDHSMLPAENLIGIPDTSRVVYRIFTLRRAQELLKERTLTLVHPTKWDDPFENFFLKGGAVTDKGEPVGLEAISSRWYGQCWTRHEDSDAMWRIYAPQKDGVRIAARVASILEAIYDSGDPFADLKCFAGAVAYLPRQNIEEILKKLTLAELTFGGQNLRFAQLLCVKRPEFEHEAELRFLYNDTDGQRGVDGLCRFAIDPVELIEGVAIDPRLSHEEFEKVRADLLSFGCPEPIIQSDLYRFEPTPLRVQ